MNHLELTKHIITRLLYLGLEKTAASLAANDIVANLPPVYNAAPDLLKECKQMISWIRECPDCDGNGKRNAYKDDPDACDRCGGYGEELYGDELQVAIDMRSIIARTEPKP